MSVKVCCTEVLLINEKSLCIAVSCMMLLMNLKEARASYVFVWH